MLSHFSVKNYKCLADVSLPLTPIHVLIGQNDTGKTSLLEAMRAAVKTLVEIEPKNHALYDVFRGDWTGPELVWNESSTGDVYFTGKFDVVTQETCSLSDFMVSYDFLKPGINSKSTEGISPSRCELNKQKINPTGPGSSTGIAEDTRRLYQPNIKRIELIKWRPKMLSKPAAITPKRRFQLDHDGFGLPKLLDEILGHNRHRFAELETAFCRYFPQFQSVRLETVKAEERIDPESEDFRSGIGKEVHLILNSGKTIRLQNASDGAILVLGFLAIINTQDPPGILLIEEPENGIHPQRLVEVAKLLREFVSREKNAPQIIMTTHSPYLLSEFKPEEVTLMKRQEDGSVKAFPLREAKHLKERMGSDFYLGEMWYNLDEEDLLK